MESVTCLSSCSVVLRYLVSGAGAIHGKFPLRLFLGTNNNHLLQKELEDLYISGMKEFYRQNDRTRFWEHIFEVFNNNPDVSAYFANNGELLKSAAMLEIHQYELSNIKNNYIK